MWDERIDDVARRLTVAAPPRDLRERILLRIENGNWPRAQQAVWRLAPVAVAIAVIVLIALRAGWHSRVAPTPAGPPTVAVQRDAPRTTPTVALAVAPPARQTDTVSTPTSAARTTRSAPPRQEQAPDFIERLTVAPLAVDGVRVDGIATPEPIELRALEMSPLSVTQLGTEEKQE